MAIVITFYLGIYYLYLFGDLESKLFFVFCSAIPLIIISLLDDLFTLKSNIRLFTQFLTVALALLSLGGIQALSLFFFELHGWWLNIPIALAMVWIINLYNFLDGIDGYAGSEAVFLGIAVALLFNYNIGWIIASASLGFLFFNWQKASIFMGDIGSTFLGFIFAVLMVDSLNQHTPIYGWFVILGVFWMDATLTLIRRAKNHEKLSQAHRKHAYQRLVQSGWSHQKTVLMAMLINIAGFIPLYWLHSTQYEFLYCLIYLAGLYITILYIDKLKQFR